MWASAGKVVGHAGDVPHTSVSDCTKIVPKKQSSDQARRQVRTRSATPNIHKGFFSPKSREKREPKIKGKGFVLVKTRFNEIKVYISQDHPSPGKKRQLFQKFAPQHGLQVIYELDAWKLTSCLTVAILLYKLKRQVLHWLSGFPFHTCFN